MTAHKTLKGYGQYFRSGMTMKEKWALDKNMRADRQQQSRDAANANKPGMGKNGG